MKKLLEDGQVVFYSHYDEFYVTMRKLLKHHKIKRMTGQQQVYIFDSVDDEAFILSMQPMTLELLQRNIAVDELLLDREYEED